MSVPNGDPRDGAGLTTVDSAEIELGESEAGVGEGPGEVQPFPGWVVEGVEVVDADDLVAVGEEAFDQMGTDESGGAGDEDRARQGGSLPCPRPAASRARGTGRSDPKTMPAVQVGMAGERGGSGAAAA